METIIEILRAQMKSFDLDPTKEESLADKEFYIAGFLILFPNAIDG